jgi:predicted metal-dependent peptidase
VTAAQAEVDVDAWLYDQIVRSRFLDRYPQYAAVLAHITPVDDPSIDVMAVSSAGGRLYLHVQRVFFARHPVWLAGVLLHEVHHLVLGHVSHPKFRGLAHPELLELAMEMSANEYIREPLPAAITIDGYEELGVGPGQSTLERYELLVRAQARGASMSPAGGKGLAFVDDHGPWMRGVERDERDEAGSAAAAELARLLVKGVEEGHELHRGTELAGRTPGDLVRELEDVVARPMDWRTALRLFFDRQRARTFDYRRPNRRFPDRIGEVPGRTRRDSENKPRIAVAIDTSASMSPDELRQIAAQLERLRQLATMVVVECDSDIQRVYPFEGKLGRVHGGGGTDLRPVFAAQLLRKLGARGVVYFTDGEGPYPLEPPGVPTLWVLTKSPAFDCPWGERVLLRPFPDDASPAWGDT